MFQYRFFVAHLSKLIPTNKKNIFPDFKKIFYVFFIILINFSTSSPNFKLDNNIQKYPIKYKNLYKQF